MTPLAGLVLVGGLERVNTSLPLSSSIVLLMIEGLSLVVSLLSQLEGNGIVL